MPKHKSLKKSLEICPEVETSTPIIPLYNTNMIKSLTRDNENSTSFKSMSISPKMDKWAKECICV